MLDAFPDLPTRVAHEEQAYSNQTRANEKAEKTARKLARKIFEEAEEQAELKAIEHRKAIEPRKVIEHRKAIEKKVIEQAEIETFRRAIRGTDKRFNITIPEVNGAFCFGAITFNTKVSTHTEGKLNETKKEGVQTVTKN